LKLGENWLDAESPRCQLLCLKNANTFTPPSFMILRSLPRPQRQLRLAFSSSSSVTSCRQGYATTTNTFQRPRCSPAPSRTGWKHQAVSARRGLATHQMGFEGHRLPALPHDEIYSEHGVDGLLSPEGYDLAWTQYQSMMIEKLNLLTVGMQQR
jgi:hypothetical protein